MIGTGMRKFGTGMILVLIGLLSAVKSSAVEPAWVGKGKFNEVSSGIIRSVLLADDHIFVGAENGFIDIVGGSSITLNRQNSILGDGYISNLTIGPDDNIWMTQYGTGVFIYSRIDKKLNKLDIPHKYSKYAWSLAVTEDYVVISLISHILVYNLKDKTYELFQDPGNGNIFKQIYSVEFSDKYGFVISEKNAIHFYNPKQNSFTSVSGSKNFPNLNGITYVKLYDNEILVGGVGGVYRWNEAEERAEFKELSYSKAVGRDVDRIIRHSDGSLWVAAGGLFRAKPGADKFELVDFGRPRYDFEQIRTIGDIKEAENGRILVASSQLGLTSINPADLAMDYVHESDFPFRKDIYAITPIGSNQYLAKTADNWRLFNGETGKLSALSGGGFDAEPVTMATGELFDSSTCSIYHYENAHLIQKAKLNDPQNYCQSIAPLSFNLNGQTYLYFQKSSHAGFVSIQDGTVKLHANAPKGVKHITVHSTGKIVLLDKSNTLYESDTVGVWVKHRVNALQGLFVYCLYEDARTELLYMCTSGSGLKQFSLADETLTEAFPNSGIPRFIRDAHLDEHGNHWLATNKGLMLVNQDFSFEFDSSDGVIDNDFNYQGMLPLNDAKLLLVGDQLSYVIDTQKMRSYVLSRRAHTSRAQVVDVETRTPRGKLVTLDSTSLATSFEKAPEEITFSFASSDFHYAHLQHLEYRLTGFHDEWSALPTNYGTITYSGLPHGTFRFEMRVVDKKSAAEQPVSVFPVKIAKPVWLSWQAICCYVLLGMLLVVSIVYLAKRYAEEQNRVLAEIIKQKQSALQEMADSVSELLAKKERLFRNLAHELRTPVMLLMGPLLDLKQAARNPEEKETLNTLYQHTSRIRSIVEQFTEVERVDSITQHELVDYDVTKSVQYVIESMRPKATSKQQVLTFDSKVKYSMLLIEDSLEKITHQLIDNAIAYTQAGGFIKVQLSESESQVHLSVSDNGVGLTPEEQKLLAERFEEGANSRGKPNMGIGLNLVNELVLANYGWLEIHSEPSVGTTCAVHIPVKRSESALQQETECLLQPDIDNAAAFAVAEPAAEYRANSLPLVLVVDDSEPSADYIAGMLSDKFKCYDVHSAEQALAMLVVLKPDLILSDLKMPGMSGIELTRAVRDLADFEDIPIILLTAETGKASRNEAYKATVNDYLTKPLEREELIVRIENQLAISALGQQQATSPQNGVKDIQSDYVKSIIPETPSDKDRAFILRLLTVVEGNYQKENFSRSDAASSLAMSERQLNRTMAKLMPDNFTQFLKRYRLEKCLPMLASGKQVTQIALEVGFGSPGYFSRCFKAEYGCLPTQMEFSQASSNEKDNGS